MALDHGLDHCLDGGTGQHRERSSKASQFHGHNRFIGCRAFVLYRTEPSTALIQALPGWAPALRHFRRDDTSLVATLYRPQTSCF
jgi:hypothetical protein